MIKKIENQLVTFNGKDKLTVDEYYSVLKVQVNFSNDSKMKTIILLPLCSSSWIVVRMI